MGVVVVGAHTQRELRFPFEFLVVILMNLIDRESREFLERKRSPPAIHRDEYSREERRHHRREDHRSREEYREEDRKRSRAQ